MHFNLIYWNTHVIHEHLLGIIAVEMFMSKLFTQHFRKEIT